MRRHSLSRPDDRTDLLRNPLPGPVHAEKRIRRLFNPVTGWFRQLERAANYLLSRHLYPRVPRLNALYDLQLRNWLTVAEADIRLRNLHPDMEGLKVLVISDVHCGSFVSPRALEDVFRRVMTLQPDLIVLAGDLVTSQVSDFDGYSEAFTALEADLGVFGVLGNHDHYTEDTDALRSLIDATGVRVLHNSQVVLQRGNGKIILAGVDDMVFGAPSLDDALGVRESGRRNDVADGHPTVLVSHNPDLFFEAARRGVDLVLSGHTHGGQIRIPGCGVLVRMSRFHLDEGRYEAGGSELVISRGLGAVGIPLRLFCPPEVVLLTLRR